MLVSEGIAAESAQPGHYGLVIEAGAYPHSRSEPFARRWLDSRGRVPPHTVLLRPKYSDLDTKPDFLEDEDAGFYSAPVTKRSFEASADEEGTIPPDVADALGKKDWPLALKLAIQGGLT
jgi:hypothetical protein